MAEHAQAFCTAAFKGDLAALREVLARHPGVRRAASFKRCAPRRLAGSVALVVKAPFLP